MTKIASKGGGGGPALRPGGSGSGLSVGDGLAWNPLPMAFKYTFLDRMQRSKSV